MDRFARYKELLSKSGFFKLVCGAGNEDIDEVRKLSYIYTLAGCKGFDVSANPEVVKACKDGIELAYDSSYSSAITPKLASQIVIATQAIGSNGIKDFSEDVLSYQYLNGHIKDRFSTYKFPAVKEEEEGTEDSASKTMASLL